jgi:hypothetical protein
MLTAVLICLVIWVLINVLFVLIMVPPRKPRKQLDLARTALSPVPLDNQNPGPVDHDEPLSLRHVIMAIAMGAFFVLILRPHAAADCGTPRRRAVCEADTGQEGRPQLRRRASHLAVGRIP